MEVTGRQTRRVADVGIVVLLAIAMAKLLVHLYASRKYGLTNCITSLAASIWQGFGSIYSAKSASRFAHSVGPGFSLLASFWL